MQNDRWKTIESLYLAAADLEKSARARFLENACQGDGDLQREIESLLLHDELGGSSLDRQAPYADLRQSTQTIGSQGEHMVGQLLDRYRIESKLGKGGMGVVYKARDTHLNRTVAIKILPPGKVSDPVRKHRFVQEAKAASALNHTGIVTIHDIRSEAGIDFIVMEYVDGKTLAQLIPDNGLPTSQVRRYGVEIAEALAKAHDVRIIHRDLKPSNVMVTVDGHIKILDFGLAKLAEAVNPEKPTRPPSALTETGMVIGTVAYMSPEQAEGRAIDARSDIFSFGAVLYEMATGRTPFAGDSSLQIMTKVVNEEPVPPSKVSSSIPVDLEKVILRCPRKDPARRFQTMTDLKVALEDVQQETTSQVDRQRSSLRWAWAVAIAVLLVTAALFTWRTWRAPQEAEPVSRSMTTLAEAGNTHQEEPIRAVPLTTLPGFKRHPSFSPGVDLTLVNATVLERVHGRIVTDLRSEDFEVWEDRVQQSIEYFSEKAPLSVGVIFNISGSLKEELSVARDAAVAFLKTGNPDDEYFLVEFTGKPEVTQDFTTDINRLRNHLMFNSANGMTALFDATYVGLTKLKDATNQKKALLLITDGEDKDSRYSFANLRDYIKKQDVELYAIGIVIDYNGLAMGRTGRALIEELTELTGGRAFFPESIYELPDICTKIAIELKNQYVLGYRSTNGAKGGEWRRISLRVLPRAGMPDMIIRGKTGYAPIASRN